MSNQNPQTDGPPTTGHPEEADFLAHLLNAREAAHVAGYDYKEFLTLLRHGLIPSRQIGPQWLTTREAVEDFVASRQEA